jgi:hypothetical protein
MGWACGMYRGRETEASVVKSEGKSRLGRRRCREEYNIKMNIKDVRCEGIDWT